METKQGGNGASGVCLHAASSVLPVLFLFALLPIPAVHAGKVLERIERGGVIRITHREASVPFSYLDDKNRPVGFAVDVCHRMAEAIRRRLKRPDLKVEYVPVTSASRIPTIVEGRADLECGSTTYNEERSRVVAFTIPYFFAGARMVVKSGSGIRNWVDLRGKTVVTTKGTTNAQSIRERSEVRGLALTLVEAADHVESFRMVEAGRADAFAMDDVLLYGLRAQAHRPQDFVVVGDPLTVEPYAIMFSRHDSALKALVDAEMAEIIHSGEFQRLYRKWFESPIPPRNANLQMPMGHMLRESLRFPSDKVNHLALDPAADAARPRSK